MLLNKDTIAARRDTKQHIERTKSLAARSEKRELRIVRWTRLNRSGSIDRSIARAFTDDDNRRRFRNLGGYESGTIGSIVIGQTNRGRNAPAVCYTVTPDYRP